MNAEEQLISEIAFYISELIPINVVETKASLSTIITKYQIRQIDNNEIHPDLIEKLNLFLSSKKLEGLSTLTLDYYELQLMIFAEEIKKKVENITTADIRMYLGNQSGLKMSSIGTKLSILKSFFSWLIGEELIQRDPTAKLTPPKTEKRLPKALIIEELEMLREACKTTRQRALIEILYATGCRLAEINGLNKDQINYQSMIRMLSEKGINKEKYTCRIKLYIMSKNT